MIYLKEISNYFFTLSYQRNYKSFFESSNIIIKQIHDYWYCSDVDKKVLFKIVKELGT